MGNFHLPLAMVLVPIQWANSCFIQVNGRGVHGAVPTGAVVLHVPAAAAGASQKPQTGAARANGHDLVLW